MQSFSWCCGACGDVNNARLIRCQALYSAVALQGGGTVTNSGTIVGVAGTAISLTAGFSNRVVDVAGGVFTGVVNGGNTIGAAKTSTLELASSTSQGTLSGLGSQFVNFARVTVDNGANWTVAGAIGTGSTIVDSGTLAPVTLTAGGVVTVAAGGTIVAPGGGQYAAVSLIGAGTLVNFGAVYAPSFYSVGSICVNYWYHPTPTALRSQSAG